VYWIRAPHHTNIFKEGYVGVTTLGVSKRFNIHKNSLKEVDKVTALKRALLKYKDTIIVETILEGSVDYCYDLEFKLRPKEQIGWNIVLGGIKGRAGMKNSPEHVAKVAEANRGKKRSEVELQKNRERGKLQMTFDFPWEHPYCNKSAWCRADDVYNWYLLHPKDGRRTVGAALDIPSDSIMKLLNKIKNGWVPREDLEWLKFKEQYEQS
jgi:hypothetical protein